MTTSIKSIDITWPHSLGFLGAVGVAAALELITIPIAILASGVPFVKRVSGPMASGAPKPVGGGGEGTVRRSPRGTAESYVQAKAGIGQSRGPTYLGVATPDDRTLLRRHTHDHRAGQNRERDVRTSLQLIQSSLDG